MSVYYYQSNGGLSKQSTAVLEMLEPFTTGTCKRCISVGYTKRRGCKHTNCKGKENKKRCDYFMERDYD